MMKNISEKSDEALILYKDSYKNNEPLRIKGIVEDKQYLHMCSYNVLIGKVYKNRNLEDVLKECPFEFKLSCSEKIKKRSRSVLYISGYGLVPAQIRSFFHNQAKILKIITKRVEVHCCLKDQFLSSPEFQSLANTVLAYPRPMNEDGKISYLHGVLECHKYSCYQIANRYSWGINFEISNRKPNSNFETILNEIIKKIKESGVLAYCRDLSSVISSNGRTPRGTALQNQSPRNKAGVMAVTRDIICGLESRGKMPYNEVKERYRKYFIDSGIEPQKINQRVLATSIKLAKKLEQEKRASLKTIQGERFIVSINQCLS